MRDVRVARELRQEHSAGALHRDSASSPSSARPSTVVQTRMASVPWRQRRRHLGPRNQPRRVHKQRALTLNRQPPRAAFPTRNVGTRRLDGAVGQHMRARGHNRLRSAHGEQITLHSAVCVIAHAASGSYRLPSSYVSPARQQSYPARTFPGLAAHAPCTAPRPAWCAHACAAVTARRDDGDDIWIGLVSADVECGRLPCTLSSALTCVGERRLGHARSQCAGLGSHGGTYHAVNHTS